MKPEQWQQVKRLFEQAKDLTFLEEISFLENNCDDPEVLKEVKSLLSNYRNADEFLEETPAKNPTITHSAKNQNSSKLLTQEFTGTSRFILQKRLGAGGFGIVYQAYDKERDLVVALKTLQQPEADELYRFKKEFRALTDLTHPNLISLYELFSEQDQWFFTMELINGINFLEYVQIPQKNSQQSPNIPKSILTKSQIVPNQDLTQPDLYDDLPIPNYPTSSKNSLSPCRANLPKLQVALKQLVRGILALHKAKKLHRDLKASNVLVTNENRVVILDFGLVSELTAQGLNKITTENIFGTPAYMSPEHAFGLAVSTASDWYSLGIMLFEALTGELPFTGTPMQILMEKQKSDGPAPSDFVSDVPEELNLLCKNLLKRNAVLRPKGDEIFRTVRNFASSITKKTTVSNSLKITLASALFVGREKELSILNDAWQSTKQGKGTTVYINGLSGIGKSTIVRYFLEKLEKTESDLLVFSGRCYEQEFMPYKAIDSIIDSLSKYLKTLPSLEVEAILPLDILALAKLFPVLRQVDTITKSKRNLTENLTSQETRRKAFSALRELLARLATKKDLILFIDDLQWGDLDSAILLSGLLQQPDAPRLLFIGSYRSEETTSSIFLNSLFSAQKSNNEFTEIHQINLEELNTSEAEKLAESLLFSASTNTSKHIENIIQESRGNPFFINELSQHLLAHNSIELKDVDMTIANVISNRISQLSKEARQLLEVIAISGQPISRFLAKKAACLESDEKILPTLRTSRLIRSIGLNTYEKIDTYHDRIREAIIATLPPDSVKQHHENLALALEESKDKDPERLAKHFQLAGKIDKAATYIASAAEQADEALAFDRAAELYRQTIEIKNTSDPHINTLKIKLGNVLANAGRGAESAKAYLAATVDSARQDVFKLQYKAAEQFLNAGYIDEGLELLNIVLKKVGLTLAKSPSSIIFSILMGRAKIWLKGNKYKEQKESEIPPEKLTLIDVCWTAMDTLSQVDTIKSIDFQTQHTLLALEVGEPYRLARAFSFESLFSAFKGNKSKYKTEKLLEITTELVEKVNKPEISAMLHLIKGAIAHLEGQWKIAWEEFSIGKQLTKTDCQGENYGFALRGIDNSIYVYLRSLFYLGNLNELLSSLPEMLKDAQERDNLFLITNLRLSALYVKHLVADEPQKAFQDLEQTSDIWTRTVFNFYNHLRLTATIDISLYSSLSTKTWDYLSKQWPELRKSGLLKIQKTLIESLQMQARTALAVVKETKDKSLLHIAEKNAYQILREKTLYGDAWAELILASVASIKGDKSSVIKYLSSCEKKFESSNMELYLAAVHRRQGEILGGAKGQAFIDISDSYMKSQKIKNPVRMTNMLAPGL